jgi:hypothetical protein
MARNGKTSFPQPKRKLGKHGLSLWNDVQSEYEVEDRAGLELLTQACIALDRAERLAEAIEREGEIVHTAKGEIRVHPGIKLELGCRSFVAKTLQKLGLNWEPVRGVGRPPAEFGAGVRLND